MRAAYRAQTFLRALLALGLVACAEPGGPSAPDASAEGGVVRVDATLDDAGARDAGSADVGSYDAGTDGGDASAEGGDAHAGDAGDAAASCPDLAAALAAARAGDVITIAPACDDGLGFVALTVPAGVTLRADHIRTTDFDVILEGDGSAPTLTLVPSADPARPTTVSGVLVRSAGRAAIVALEEGHVAISDVRVDVSAGIGIGLERVSATIRDSAIHSTFSRGMRDAVPVPADDAAVGTWGVVARAGADVTLVDSGMGSFANGCMAVVGARATATGTRFFVCRTHGVLAYGATLDFTGVQLDNHYRRTGSTSRALTLAGGSTLTASDLVLNDDEGDGVFVDGSSAADIGALDARTLGGAAVWVQRDATIMVRGASTIDAASGGGIVALGASAVTVRDTTIRSSASATLARDAGGTASFGDGIVIAGIVMPPTIELSDVALDANARVGLVIDGGGLALPSLSIVRVSVSGTGAQLGAIAQDVAGLPASWDAGITRDADTTANDAVAGVLDVPGAAAGIVMPPTIVF